MAISNLSEAAVDNSARDHIPCEIDQRRAPCEACSSLKEANSQILPNLLVAVPNVDEQKRILRTKVNYGHDPVHRIPLEIAAQIFTSYLDVTASARFASLLLASVCHTWRSIALSTPQLWTSIHIQIMGESSIEVRTELAKQWLRRSGQLPLSISLTFADTYPTHMVEPLFEVMREYSLRWRHLTLRIASLYYQKLVNRHDTLPSLEEILLYPPTESIWVSADTFAVGPTPALRHLAVSNISLAKVPVSWAQLTTFSATDIFLADIMGLLRTAPALERMRLARISGSTGIFPLPTTPITHNALRALSLHPDGDVAAKLELLLARLELPELERLECDFTGSRDRIPVEAIVALVARSACTLTYFGARVTEPDTRMTDTALVILLQGVPTLTHLAIFSQCTVPILSDALLERLACRVADSEEDVILPQLDTLEFRGRRTFSWAALAPLFPTDKGTDIIAKASQIPINKVQMRLSHNPSDDPFELIPKGIRQLLHARMTGLCADIIDTDGSDILIDTHQRWQ